MKAYRYGIVGSRRRKDERLVRITVKELYQKYGDDLEIVSGGCEGVDSWVEDEAKKLGLPDKNITIFVPNLNNIKNYYDACQRYYNRNKMIAEYCKILIAFVAEDRKGGTENTIKYAKKLGKIVIIK